MTSTPSSTPSDSWAKPGGSVFLSKEMAFGFYGIRPVIENQNLHDRITTCRHRISHAGDDYEDSTEGDDVDVAAAAADVDDIAADFDPSELVRAHEFGIRLDKDASVVGDWVGVSEHPRLKNYFFTVSVNPFVRGKGGDETSLLCFFVKCFPRDDAQILSRIPPCELKKLEIRSISQRVSVARSLQFGDGSGEMPPFESQ